MPVAEDKLLSPKEVGAILGVHARTVVRLAERGELPYLRIGDLWRFRREDVDTYIADHIQRNQPKTEP